MTTVEKNGLDRLKKSKQEEYALLSTNDSGFYGMARVISLPYKSSNEKDYLKGRIVIDAKITHLSRKKPMVKYDHSPVGEQYMRPQKIEVVCLFD